MRRRTRAVLVVEIVVLSAVAVLPAGPATWLTVSSVAAVQAATSRSLGGQVYSRTLLTGNLRTLVLVLTRAALDRDLASLRAAGPVLVLFCAGAAAGALLSQVVGTRALLLAVAALLLVLVVIVVETGHLERLRKGS